MLADKIIKLDEGDVEEIIKTKLNLITNAQYKYLDNVYGPFDTFTEYSSTTETVPFQKTQNYTKGENPTMSIDFSGYNDVSDLNNVGIKIGNSTYIFTDDMSKTYDGMNVIKVPLGEDIDATINNLKNKSGGTINDKILEIKTSVSGAGDEGGTKSISQKPAEHDGPGAGVKGTTSGGVTNKLDDPDLPDAAKATLTVDVSDVANDSGFRFENKNFRVIESDGEPLTRDGTITLTKGQSSSGPAGDFSYAFDGSNLTFTANKTGAGYNGHSIINGYKYTTPVDPIEKIYDAYNSFNPSAIITVDAGTSDIPAIWEYDLSDMTVEKFSNMYAGKTFNGFKLYDSYLTPRVGSIVEDAGSHEDPRTQIDIDDIRQAVNNGKTLAQAIAERIISGGTADGDKIVFERYNNYGMQINIQTETLRHYDLDFSNLGVKIPDDLYGKGFRAYCATDNREWFNFIFTDGTDTYDTDKDNIKSINIDVSGVTNATQLVKTIYKQGNALLTGTDSKFNHHMRLAVDPDNKIVTLYDHRRFDVSGYPEYQEMGAKIADGISFKDDYDREKRNFSVKDLVIQHTDKAGMNIHIKIPQMTLDHIFDPLPINPSTIFDYPVTLKKSRDYLLGNPNPPGILNNGLKYLLDAATLVGAQNRRLEFTAGNITTEIENLTASESVITDADMAKEMTEYTKANVLSQAAQAMLAQANQNQSMVLSLLE